MSNVIDIRTRKVIENKVKDYSAMSIAELQKELVGYKDQLMNSNGGVTKEQAERGIPIISALVAKAPDGQLKLWASMCYVEMMRILHK